MHPTNLQDTLPMFSYCLQTLITVQLSLVDLLTGLFSVNKLPPATADYFISLKHLLPFICTPIPMFSCIVFKSEMWLFGSNSSKTTSGLLYLVDGCTWVPLVFTSSWLMALLMSKRTVSMMCLSSAKLSLLGWPKEDFCFFKIIWNPSLFSNGCLPKTLLIQYNYLASCSCAQFAIVYDLWHKPVFYNLTLEAVWLFITQL